MAAEQRITPVLLEVYKNIVTAYMNSYKSKDSYTKKFPNNQPALFNFAFEKALLKSFKDGIFEGTPLSLSALK